MYLVNVRDHNEEVWYWHYNNTKLYYDVGESVRLKVIELTFKNSGEINKIVTENKEINTKICEESKKISLTADNIMEVLCTFNQEGLGPIKWWQSN